MTDYNVPPIDAPTIRKIDTRAGELYDFAVDHPDGFVYEDVQQAFGWRYEMFNATVRHLRSILGADGINLVCTPQGRGERWVYQLVGTHDAARPWSTNRIVDLETRLDTIHNVATSLTHATDGRSVEGRKARLVERTVRHLLENLTDLPV